MITYLLLGQHGRLGNQMFQYALLLGVSSKNNYSFAIPKEHHSLKECFDIKCKAYSFSDAEKIIKSLNFYREKYFHFNENIFDLKDNIVYAGNFQSEKYFKHCDSLVREQFSFKDSIKQKASEFINSLRNKYNKTVVAVHVRRGDYLFHKDSHPIPSIEWYEKAFNKFDINNTVFVVFSDDLEWCRNNFPKNYTIEYSNLTTNFEDLCAMSLCDHNIIANSSFSWWGAWLNTNKNKKIIAPKKWFGPAYNYHQTQDLYCDGWTIL